ncbi:IPT/TIG domain-containing protein [Actinoplanes sp. CA-015351]|uniref:IPT/TIG domain-containing protein n=1 Tax=Actinoplanes sp. CA-015351 TaxID=3239897 RepID=UPI003D9890A7
MGNRTRARRASAIVAATVTGLSVIVVHPGAVFSAASVPVSPRTRTISSLALPSVTSIAPTSGSMAGGTAVTVRGTNFLTLDRTNKEAVMFGDVPASRFVIKSDKEVLAISPPGTEGPVAVKVTSLEGDSETTAEFTYQKGLGIEITSVEASAAGGAKIIGTVTGGTVGSTAAAFKGMRITAAVGEVSAPVAWVDATHLRITIPPTSTAAAATVTLIEAGAAGTPSTGTVDYYPVVTRVSPSRVSTAGGATVQIMGAGFLGVDESDPSAVTFGAAPATSFTVVSGTQIDAVVPEAPSGSVAVQVATVTGSSRESDAARVIYRGPLTFDLADDTQFLRAGGGQHILGVTGGTVGDSAKAFTAEKISVKMGTTKLQTAWVDSTHLRVSLPSLTAETVTLTILQDVTAGPAATLPVAPVITNMSSNSSSLAGGKSVKITVAGTDSATDFTFGSNPATCKAVQRSTTVFLCTVPAATAAGPVRVSFKTGTDVSSRYTAASAFSYSALD